METTKNNTEYLILFPQGGESDLFTFDKTGAAP
jgi:hypothetical protein